MSDHVCSICGATAGKTGRTFTQYSLLRHTQDKHPDEWAKGEKKREKRRRYKVNKRKRQDAIYQEFPVLEMADMLGDDLPDGAYWALVEEMGGI